MPRKKETILESWPRLKEDLQSFIADTDAWLIAELKQAYQAKDWDRVGKVIDIMEMVHSMAHEH